MCDFFGDPLKKDIRPPAIDDESGDFLQRRLESRGHLGVCLAAHAAATGTGLA